MPRKTAVPAPPEIADRIKHEVAAPGFLSALIAWADRQCGKLLSIEDRVDPHKAIDLVNAAVVDTWDGVRAWHPEARTLRRQLEREGTRFSTLLEDARRRDALRLLDNPALSAARVAAMLGYEDPANFTRAFRRWTGRTPTRYRQERSADR